MLPTYAFVPNILSPWWIAGSSIDLKFTESRYYDSSAGGPGQSVTSYLSCSRASIGYAQNSDGTLTQFSNDTLRIGSGTGLLVEDTRTNVVLWCRDLTNAAWTPSGITAAKDQTGPDGVSNSASSITATAGNGTILQSITLASSDRFQSAYVKRITGSGTVNMTMDNGSTWTAISPTSAWTQLTIPTQTLANPTVGFQIVTSGDKIAVDFVQNENGTFGSSPIPTTTTSAARAEDVVACAGNLDTVLKGSAASICLDVKRNTEIIANNNYAFLLFATYQSLSVATNLGGDRFLSQSTTLTYLVENLGNSKLWTDGIKIALAYNAAGGRSAVAAGGTVGTDADNIDTSGSIYIGSANIGSNDFCGYFRRLTVWNSRLIDSVLQSLTAP